MKRTLIFLFTVVLASLITSCGGGDSEPITPPTPPADEIILDKQDESIIFNESASSRSVSFRTSNSWKISVPNESSDWLSVSPLSGKEGTSSINISVKANDDVEGRSSEVVLSSGSKKKTILVTQAQKDALVIAQASYTVPQTGGDITVKVGHNVEFDIAIDCDWIQQKRSRGYSEDNISFEVSENKGYDNRESVIAFVSKDKSLRQEVKVFQSEGKGLLVSPTEKNFDSEAHTFDIQVNTNVDFLVKDPSADWIHKIESRALAPHTIRYAIDANSSVDSRQAEIRIESKDGSMSEVVTVTQAQKDALVIAQANYTVPKTGGDITIKVGHNVEYTLNINVDWITQVQARAYTEEQLVFNVSENTGKKAREGIITFRSGSLSQEVKVSQQANSLVIDGDKATIEADGMTTDDLNSLLYQFEELNVKELTLKGNISNITFSSILFKYTDLTAVNFAETTGWPTDTDNLVEFPERVFYDNQTIQRVILPNEVQSIGDFAFYKCASLQSVSALNLKQIGSRVFDSCKKLVDIDFPNIEKLGQQAFKGCSSLPEVNMPKVTLVDRGCFMFSGVKKVILPKVKKLEGTNFWFCRNLTDVELPELETLGEATDGKAPTRIAHSVFADCSLLETISLPNAVIIGDGTFGSCEKLKSVDLPKAREFGSDAFAKCKSLQKIVLPCAIKLNFYTFRECPNVRQVSLLSDESISLDKFAFDSFDSMTAKIDLTLHPNKKSEVSIDKYTQKNKWKGHVWNSISFAK